jgi:hypothetical protein
MSAKLVIAVDVVGSHKRYTAAAVVYPVNDPEPTFEYRNARGRKRRARFLSQPKRLPMDLTTSVIAHLRRSVLSWAVTTQESKTAAKGLAVVRCLERLMHTHPEALQGIGQEEIHVYLPDGEKLASEFVNTTPQVLDARSWRTGAAYLLALTSHESSRQDTRSRT